MSDDTAEPGDTFSRDVLLQALTIAPCHVTGMHDPTHTTRYVCDSQKVKAFDSLLRLLGVTAADLPRRMDEYRINDAKAGRIPTTQRDRDALIAEWAWAGGAPLALFTPGRDIPQPGDEEALLAVLTDEWQTWQRILPQLDGWVSERYHAVAKSVLALGLAEARDISLRRKAAAS